MDVPGIQFFHKYNFPHLQRIKRLEMIPWSSYNLSVSKDNMNNVHPMFADVACKAFSDSSCDNHCRLTKVLQYWAVFLICWNITFQNLTNHILVNVINHPVVGRFDIGTLWCWRQNMIAVPKTNKKPSPLFLLHWKLVNTYGQPEFSASYFCSLR